LNESRQQFTTLLLEKMRAPDGSYEDGFIAPGGEKLPVRTVQPGNLERNNPLSLHDEVRTLFDRTDERVFGILTMLTLGPL
jgi:TBC1 domain family protein 5